MLTDYCSEISGKSCVRLSSRCAAEAWMTMRSLRSCAAARCCRCIAGVATVRDLRSRLGRLCRCIVVGRHITSRHAAAMLAFHSPYRFRHAAHLIRHPVISTSLQHSLPLFCDKRNPSARFVHSSATVGVVGSSWGGHNLLSHLLQSYFVGWSGISARHGTAIWKGGLAHPAGLLTPTPSMWD